MGDANCPECGGGFTCEDLVKDGEIITATCLKCKTEFDVEVSITYDMA